MNKIFLILFSFLFSVSLFSQVKHFNDSYGNPVVNIEISGSAKSYTLQEYHPSFDLKFYSSEKGFGNRISQPKAEFYYYSDANSLVFITKSNNENIGTFTQKKNDLWKSYDIYNNRIEEHMPKEFDCKALETGRNIELGDFISGKCANLYTEWDYNFYQQAGNLNNALSRIQAILGQSQWLFDRDSIQAKYNEVFVWTIPDPYTGTSSSQQLSLFRTYHQPFTDDLAQLCEINPGNLGGVAYLNGFCTSYNVSYADINYTYSNVPAYSWTIHVITHEFGHLLGSRHTHWCGWPGGPIDNCYTPEGTCSPGPSPSNGGTIMSYCHLNTGINFNNGFGNYPKQYIQSAINNASCLAECGPPPPPPPPTNCNDLYEPNNIRENSANIVKNQAYHAGLDKTGDIDWYYFRTSRNNTNINMTFSNLSAPTVIELYQNNTLVKTITNSGSLSIIYNSAFIGSYYIRSAPVSGILNGCYNFNLQLGKKQFIETQAISEPEAYKLEQNYPNPFNSSTKISYNVPLTERNARIVVYDILGKEIQNSFVNNGAGSIILDLSSEKFSSGVYFYKLISDSYSSEFKKLVLMK